MKDTESDQGMTKRSGAVGAGKFTPRYWESRVYRPTYGTSDGPRAVSEFYAQIQFSGRREQVPLGTNDRLKASRLAAKFYVELRAHGWDGAFTSLPGSAPRVRADEPTVGDLVQAARAAFRGSAKTFMGYETSFRRIAAEAAGITDPHGERFDYRGGGNARWLAKVDAIKLASLTPMRVDAWKRDFLKAAGATPLSLQRARRNVNSFIRQARGLFSRALIKRMAISLPNPLPFAGVEFEPEGSTRYVATFNAGALMASAQAELRDEDPEAWKAILLLLCAGLRRGELDLLCWTQVDPAEGTINVRTTDFFSPKTRTSERVVPLAPSIAFELERFRPDATGLFVIESTQGPPPPGTRDRRYRCQDTFGRLVTWLRAHGVTADKPLHELRKEFGSLVAGQADLFTASRLLGHSGLDVTQRFYAEARKRVVVDLLSPTSLAQRREAGI